MDGRRLSKVAVMAFSGGMDSTGLLVHLLANDYEVHTLSYDYGQKHKLELDRAKANIDYLSENNIKVTQRIVDLQSAMSIFHSALTTEDYEVPEGHYEEEQMKQTVVPNRNAIFASILYGYALSIATKNDTSVKIGLGVHSGDHEIYPDCRPEYISAYEKTANLATKAGVLGNKFKIHTPLINMTKSEIISTGIKLGVDYGMTSTCYDPKPNGNPCGNCDACFLRLKGFDEANTIDPLNYTSH